MPIPVRCQCGAAFAAKDDLAGRTVRCPQCQSPLAIPAARPAAGNAPGRPPDAAAQARQAAARNAAAAGQSMGGMSPATAPAPILSSLLDEAGMASAQRGEKECPGCRKTMPITAILCINCGYNLSTGTKVKGAYIKTAGGDGHGDAAEHILARAAATIDEDAAEAKKAAVGEGMPWWGVGLIFLGVTTFLFAMLLIPKQLAFMYAGITLYVLFGLLAIYVNIMWFVQSYRESPTQMALNFIPFYGFYYLFTRWDRMGPLFLMSLAAPVLFFAGWGMVTLAPMMKEDPKPEKDGKKAALPGAPRDMQYAAAPARVLERRPTFVA